MSITSLPTEARPLRSPSARGNSASLYAAMVGLGLGVGVVPELVIRNSTLREQIQVLDVPDPLVAFSVGLCAAQQRLENPCVRAFWDTASAAYA